MPFIKPARPSDVFSYAASPMRHIEIRARNQPRSSLQLLVKFSPTTTSTTPHSCYQSLAKSLLCACTPTHQPNLLRPHLHARNKLDQPCMHGISTQGRHLRPLFHAFRNPDLPLRHLAHLRWLESTPLVHPCPDTPKKLLVPRIAKHSFEVIHDVLTLTYAIAQGRPVMARWLAP